MPPADPSVSIVIAAHNEGALVLRTVESILKHTASPEFDIVLVDDGSTDSSFGFLESDPYRRDGRLRCYRFEQSVGCIRARHQGVRLGRGEHVVFLDGHMAVPSGWLETLTAALEKWGPNAAVTPDIAGLNQETWTAEAPSGQVVALDDKLDFSWTGRSAFPNFMPTVLGCCMILPRRLYYRSGGFDLGLRRWGSEFTDLILKVYAAGGACYLEPGVLVGHLFRSQFPYSMNYRDVTYNKLRTAFVHFSSDSFRRLLDRLATEPGFDEATVLFREDLSELRHLREAQQANRRRDPEWWVRTFLPALGEGSGPAHETGRKRERSSALEQVHRAETIASPPLVADSKKAHALESREPTHKTPAHCMKCKAALQPGEKFCSTCGTPADGSTPVAIAPASKREFCHQCGAALGDDANRCDACGALIANPMAPDQPVAAPPIDGSPPAPDATASEVAPASATQGSYWAFQDKLAPMTAGTIRRMNASGLFTHRASRELVARMIRAALLDKSIYREVASDPALQTEAWIVTGLVIVLGSLGWSLLSLSNMSLQVLTSLIWLGVVQLVGWLVGIWAVRIGIATLLGRKITFSQIFRPLAYAQSAGCLRIIPIVGPFVGLWCVITSIAAIRDVTGCDTGRAVVLTLIGLVAGAVTAAGVGSFL